MEVGQYAVLDEWSFDVVEILSHTEKQIRYNRGHGERRASKNKVLKAFDLKVDAEALSEKLTSAKREMNRRRQAASTWYYAKIAELTA